MSGRLFNKTVRCGGVTSGISSRRTFTSSPASLVARKLNHLPSFTETSSAELDALLAEVRKMLILPAYISTEQKKLIYSSNNKDKLEAETFTANVRGEEFRLQYIDKTKQPPSRKSLKDAMALFKDKRDWDNLPSLLKGLTKAHSGPNYLGGYMGRQVLRTAVKAGRLDVLMDCARRGKTTGLSLRDPELAEDYMWYIQDKAFQSGWNPSDTRLALSWAQTIARLLEEEEHKPDRRAMFKSKAQSEEAIEGKELNKLQSRKDPLVIGVLLQLAAIRAQQVTRPTPFILPNGETQTPEVIPESSKEVMVQRVTQYAQRFLSSQLDTIQLPIEPNPAVPARSLYLSKLVPIIHGLKAAQTIIAPTTKIAEELKAQQTRLEGMASTLRELILADESFTGSKERLVGMVTYDKLLAAKSS